MAATPTVTSKSAKIEEARQKRAAMMAMAQKQREEAVALRAKKEANASGMSDMGVSRAPPVTTGPTKQDQSTKLAEARRRRQEAMAAGRAQASQVGSNTTGIDVCVAPPKPNRMHGAPSGPSAFGASSTFSSTSMGPTANNTNQGEPFAVNQAPNNWFGGTSGSNTPSCMGATSAGFVSNPSANPSSFGANQGVGGNPSGFAANPWGAGSNASAFGASQAGSGGMFSDLGDGSASFGGNIPAFGSDSNGPFGARSAAVSNPFGGNVSPFESTSSGTERRLSFGGSGVFGNSDDTLPPSTVGGFNTANKFEKIYGTEDEPPRQPSPVAYHTITKCSDFNGLSMEQYHWLEMENKASLWQHTPAARDQVRASASIANCTQVCYLPKAIHACVST